MRVLIVKMTSLGDVIHTLPALTDAAKVYPDIEFDWVVEKPFAEIPAWHPHVKRVIPIALRQWRKSPFSNDARGDMKACIKTLHHSRYDIIIDAQGLIKSAVVARMAKGTRVGFDKTCAREGLASLFYDQGIAVDPKAHAIDRVRTLFAKALDYQIDLNAIDYGITKVPERYHFQTKTVLLLHGTTWPTKHWPEHYWRDLAKHLTANNIAVKCVWGNDTEKKRAEMICQDLSLAEVMPELSLSEIASLIHATDAVVTVDTGLGHMAAALHKPTISIYGPTDPKRTGTRGPHQNHIQEHLPCVPCLQERCTNPDFKIMNMTPCMGQVTPEVIFKQLERQLLGGQS